LAAVKRSVVRKVFLSSAARDLGRHREAVYRAICGLDGFQCVRRETFGAWEREADPFCGARVAECDVFVGLVGYLYGGFLPEGMSSFTEGEYEAAVTAKIPRLLFMASESFPLAPALRETDDLWQRQQLFRERVKRDRLVAFFESSSFLVTQAVAALRRAALPSSRKIAALHSHERTGSAVVEDLIAKALGPPGEDVVTAGQVVADGGNAGVTPVCRQVMVGALLNTMRSAQVKARQRVSAGRLVAELGDPRPEVMTVDGMEFCLIPAGPFQMGREEHETQWKSETPAHAVDLPYEYLLGRFPVTVSQFRQYLRESRRKPAAADRSGSIDNWPVSSVTWHEAQDFSAWLTERWHATGALAASWRATLPSEAEWEKAARGGTFILAEPQIGRVASLSPKGRLLPNLSPGRAYPWGGPADPERMSYRETGIGEPSAVGCFPEGTGPYGCEEMCGNVWSWTRSLVASYPYPAPGQSREHREDPAAAGPRVLRGGAYGNDLAYVGCAVRLWSGPAHRIGNIGFRVALLPFTSTFS